MRSKIILGLLRTVLLVFLLVLSAIPLRNPYPRSIETLDGYPFGRGNAPEPIRTEILHQLAEFQRGYSERELEQVEEFTEGLASYFRENASKGPGALVRLRRFAHRHARVFEQYDVLMNPTLATPPPELGFIGPEVPFETALERLKWFIPFTPVQNVSGTPAISLPLTRSQGGLPIGIQLGSAMGAERTLLELAIELEEASPWPTLAG